jgi:hypothetical protein
LVQFPKNSTYAAAGELEEALSPISLRGRTIQCIIKLANIHLTPKHPKYAGMLRVRTFYIQLLSLLRHLQEWRTNTFKSRLAFMLAFMYAWLPCAFQYSFTT